MQQFLLQILNSFSVISMFAHLVMVGLENTVNFAFGVVFKKSACVGEGSKGRNYTHSNTSFYTVTHLCWLKVKSLSPGHGLRKGTRGSS